ncbi:UDP-glucose 4-epimerase GalE [Prochlorococcus sp. AH-716-K03]|nr:UDP-glucose 4-epimerase GalE [Prochlorococcus sp. AH-716-K03]
MKRVLLTGGVGFIGSHVCIELLVRNYEVIILDSFVNSSEDFFLKIKNLVVHINPLFLKRIHLYKGDIRDSELLDRIFLESKKENKLIECVIHLAGLKAVKESLEKPLKYWDVNLIGAIKLLESMEKNNCRVLIFSSSATIYGNSEKKLIGENSKISPISTYGFNKVSIENMLTNLFESNPNKWRIANLRYFNPIGAHNTGMIGESPKGTPNNIFPLITKVASKKISKLKIYGENWDTNDGTCVRDFIHVMDLAEGHILTMEYLLNNYPQILNLNLGTGFSTSVLELVETFQETNNINVPYEFVERREGDVAMVVADNSLANKILNWKPKRTIRDMCKDGWKWELNNVD